MGMRHPGHVLVDDRALIEVGGDVVGGGADQLHPPLPGLVVGLGPLEPGQERVVDVDGASLELPADRLRQDLHVAGQHHQVDLVGVDQLEQAGVGLVLVLWAGGQLLEGDAVAHHQVAEVGVVGHHHRDVDGQLPRPPAVEEVDQAVVVLRHHDDHPLALVLPADAHGGAQLRRSRLERVLHPHRRLHGRLEAGAHDERVGGLVAELGVLQDVGVELDQPLGDAGHDPRPVGGDEGEDVDRHRPNCAAFGDRP